LTPLWIADVFGDRAWIAAELTASGGDRLRLERLMALSRDCGLPLVASGDVHMHVRARRALQDTLTAIRLKTPLADCGYALFPNGERHLRSRAKLATIYPSELLPQTLALVERCTFSLDELRYEYPEEIAPSGETPTSYLRRLTEAGLQKRYGDRVPDDVRTLVAHELGLIAELRYEAYFLAVADILAFGRRWPRRSSPIVRRAPCATSARRSVSISRKSIGSRAFSRGGMAARSIRGVSAKRASIPKIR